LGLAIRERGEEREVRNDGKGRTGFAGVLAPSQRGSALAPA